MLLDEIVIRDVNGSRNIEDISELFENANYSINATGETLMFTRLAETDDGDSVLVEFDLFRENGNSIWVGKTCSITIDENGNCEVVDEEVHYTLEDLLDISNFTMSEPYVADISDDYSASENVEHFHFGWSNDADEDTEEERFVNFFGSRFIGNYLWIVTAEVWHGDESKIVLVGEMSDFQVIDLMDNFEDKYYVKYFSQENK